MLNQLAFVDVGCLWDFPWLLGYFVCIIFNDTEGTALFFMGGDIYSSSEVMPTGFGSELEGRPEILRIKEIDVYGDSSLIIFQTTLENQRS